MRRPRRGPAAFAIVLAGAVLGVLPGHASAHAVLTHTAPHSNATVQTAPERVRLDFNEPVEAAPGTVRVYDADGGRVDRGVPRVPASGARSVEIDLREDLGRGVYTATYRVVSADGHPVSGGFAFGVGTAVATAGSRPDVADLLERSSAGALVEGLYGAARGLHYAALLLIVGAVVFRLLVWPAGTDRAWPSRLLAGAAALGFTAALAAIALQAALAAGVPLSRAFDGEVLRAALDTRTGEAWLVRAATWWFVLVLLALFGKDPSRVTIAGLAAAAGIVIATLPWAGHAGTQAPAGVLVPADVLHAVAAGAWLGGLVLLLAAFWPRAAAEDGALDATRRFSRIALPAIVVVVAAGVAEAWFYVGSVPALVQTTYGVALLAKLALVAVVVWLGARNRSRLRGAVPGAGALRRAMRAEVGLAAAVLAATAVLVRAEPPVAAGAGPVVRELDLGPLRVQLDVEPAAAGPNDLHVYLFDRRTGEQVGRVQELEVRLEHRERGIGPITLDIPRKGPAHYELLRAGALAVPGTWHARVSARVTEFDEHTASTTFEVR